jgi:CheY-like chemotaxis protein
VLAAEETDVTGWILVVDDDPDICEAIETVLRRHGISARSAGDGRSALAILRAAAPPAAMLIDLHMPVMSGPELIAAVRRDPALARVRLIGLSGALDTDASADELSLDQFLVKPIDVPALLAAVAPAVGAGGEGARR